MDDWKKRLKKKLRHLELQRQYDMRMRSRQLKDKKFKDNLMLDYYMVRYNPKTKKWESARKTKDIESVL